jgi:nicotinamidase-related amidase
MTTAQGKSALLVIDVQNGVVMNAWQKEPIVARINSAIDSARSAGLPVVWVQHSEEEMPIGSDFWQIIPELVPQGNDARIDKIHGSSFQETNLAEVLGGFGTKHLYVTGAQSENCVNATTVDALGRGFEVTLISDAHTTDEASVVGDINQKFAALETGGKTVVVKTLAETLPLS